MFEISADNSKSSNKLSALLGYGKTPRMSDEQLHLLNYDHLMELVRFLVKLKRAGSIDNKEFNSLINMVGGSFIEREMGIRLNKVLSKIF